MPSDDPIPITSYLPSSVQNLSDETALGHSCISSSKSNVFPSINLTPGLLADILSFSVSTSRSPENSRIIEGSSIKFMNILARKPLPT